MNKNEPEVVDPDNRQLQALQEAGADTLAKEDLADPAGGRVLQWLFVTTLTQHTALKKELAFVRQENSQLRDDREGLRTKIATLQERLHASLLEIPIGVLTGFSINMLTSEPKNNLAWCMLVVSVLSLILLRARDRLPILGDLSRKGRDHE